MLAYGQPLFVYPSADCPDVRIVLETVDKEVLYEGRNISGNGWHSAFNFCDLHVLWNTTGDFKGYQYDPGKRESAGAG